MATDSIDLKQRLVVTRIMEAPSSWVRRAHRLAPWLGGAGIALGHIAASTNCTVPQQGRCGACGSCVLVVGSLVGWAWAKRHRADDFYLGDGSTSS